MDRFEFPSHSPCYRLGPALEATFLSGERKLLVRCGDPQQRGHQDHLCGTQGYVARVASVARLVSKGAPRCAHSPGRA